MKYKDNRSRQKPQLGNNLKSALATVSQGFIKLFTPQFDEQTTAMRPLLVCLVMR